MLLVTEMVCKHIMDIVVNYMFQLVHKYHKVKQLQQLVLLEIQLDHIYI